MKASRKPEVPAVLTPTGRPGVQWRPDIQAPSGNGSNVSIPPMFGGAGPAVEITGVDSPKLAVGNAEPAFHGGG